MGSLLGIHTVRTGTLHTQITDTEQTLSTYTQQTQHKTLHTQHTGKAAIHTRHTHGGHTDTAHTHIHLLQIAAPGAPQCVRPIHGGAIHKPGGQPRCVTRSPVTRPAQTAVFSLTHAALISAHKAPVTSLRSNSPLIQACAGLYQLGNIPWIPPAPAPPTPRARGEVGHQLPMPNSPPRLAFCLYPFLLYCCVWASGAGGQIMK